jgi:hypothetical protein
VVQARTDEPLCSDADLGDFNLPKIDPADPIFKALTRTGL